PRRRSTRSYSRNTVRPQPCTGIGLRPVRGRSERDVVVRSAATAAAAAEATTIVVGLGWRRTVVARASTTAAAAAGARVRAAASSVTTAEELHVVGDDLGGVAILAFLVLVLASLDPALDVHLAALRQVLRTDLGALAPDDHPVPLGALLLLPVLVDP